MQRDPEPAYNFRLIEHVIEYLQTRDANLFPFTAGFDEEREKAFVRDLRDGLSDVTDSGSARKTAAVGFIMNDHRLAEIVEDWARAGGGWPASADPAALNARIAPQSI